MKWAILPLEPNSDSGLSTDQTMSPGVTQEDDQLSTNLVNVQQSDDDYGAVDETVDRKKRQTNDTNPDPNVSTVKEFAMGFGGITFQTSDRLFFPQKHQ